MNSETRKCQNCKSDFVIEPDDFKFYEKISVPPPTFCPECRLQRRLAFRNERNLYRRNCNLCGRDIVSMWQKNVPFPVYCQECWWSDKWDGIGFGREFDESKSFLEQFAELQKLIPRPQYFNYESARLVRSPYANCSGDLEDCYLVFATQYSRNCAYTHYLNNGKDSFDMLYSDKAERCYDSQDIENCYNVSFSVSSSNCVDSMFLFDCKNCNDCLGCSGLRNKKYHILNKPFSKEEYEKKKKELKLNTSAGVAEFRKKFFDEIYYNTPRKYYHGQMNSNFSGDYISNTENTFEGFYTKNTRNVKYSFWCLGGDDVYDYFAWGDLHKSYEVVSSGDNSFNIKFTYGCWGGSRNIEYSTYCISCNDLFGCVGLRHKKFSILNKQYSEDEYYKLREKIIKQMTEKSYVAKDGIQYKYGEFFPIELSIMFYNETVAEEHFPLTQEEALAKGYLWNEGERGSYVASKKGTELPQSISDVGDDILNEVIECRVCKRPYRIIEPELKFYKEMDLPLPQLCPDSRHLERIKLRNPLKLWKRKCECNSKKAKIVYQNTAVHEHGESECLNEFETSYAPERPEIVYCEQCYLKEVV
ncbi:hypothetical protein HYT00_01955 [Candidatus Giovannonibacteria bacterium]|nr:hypothetical protein [Candidatus Giovannonibacteria bacterium]